MIVFIVYILTFLTTLILSFTLSGKPGHRAAQLTATALAVPIGLALLATGVFFIFVIATAPPTLDQLQKRFPAQQHDLETLLSMSDQDSRFRRIDPQFLDQMAPDGKTFQGRYMAGDAKADLSEARWNQYRTIFKRNHIEQGIERDSAHDAFIRFDAQGLLDRGHATGIVFCADPVSSRTSEVFRYEPCVSNEPSGSGNETENPHREAFSFRKLVGRWYAYDQGPG